MDNPILNPKIVDFVTTLTNPERLKIVGALATKPLSLEEISAELQMPANDVARHLEPLAQIGLIQNEGPCYRLAPAAVEAMARQTLASQPRQPRLDDFDGDAYERKVLHDYLRPDGTLKDLPSQQKKLLVVLNHLLQQFEPGRRYSEPEVNDIFRRYHSDYASLRRYMIDFRLMQRDKGLYWRAA